MTYEHDLDRNRLTSTGVGDYQTNHDTGKGSGKWLLLTILLIVGLLGAAAIFSGEATVTFKDGALEGGQVETISPAPAQTNE